MVKNVGTLSQIASLTDEEFEAFIALLPKIHKFLSVFQEHSKAEVNLCDFKFDPLKNEEVDVWMELARCTYSPQCSEKNRSEQIQSLTKACIDKDKTIDEQTKIIEELEGCVEENEETIQSLNAEVAELKKKYDLLAETIQSFIPRDDRSVFWKVPLDIC